MGLPLAAARKASRSGGGRGLRGRHDASASARGCRANASLDRFGDVSIFAERGPRDPASGRGGWCAGGKRVQQPATQRGRRVVPGDERDDTRRLDRDGGCRQGEAMGRQELTVGTGRIRGVRSKRATRDAVVRRIVHQLPGVVVFARTVPAREQSGRPCRREHQQQHEPERPAAGRRRGRHPLSVTPGVPHVKPPEVHRFAPRQAKRCTQCETKH